VIRGSIVAVFAITCAAGCASSLETSGSREHQTHAHDPTSTTEPAAGETDSEAALFAQLDETFGRKGEVTDGVYRLVTPRPDLFVTVNGMDVPTGAFLESDFRFWRCPCGKALVNGQFVVADYEANDVINELQLGHVEIASLGPLLLNEHPRLLLIRFQGEGDAGQLAKTLKSSLSYTGAARNKPAPANLAPEPE
jgi:hypothetical protein